MGEENVNAGIDSPSTGEPQSTSGVSFFSSSSRKNISGADTVLVIFLATFAFGDGSRKTVNPCDCGDFSPEVGANFGTDESLGKPRPLEK